MFRDSFIRKGIAFTPRHPQEITLEHEDILEIVRKLDLRFIMNRFVDMLSDMITPDISNFVDENHVMVDKLIKLLRPDLLYVIRSEIK